MVKKAERFIGDRDLLQVSCWRAKLQREDWKKDDQVGYDKRREMEPQ
jgi:hypothetical protein